MVKYLLIFLVIAGALAGCQPVAKVELIPPPSFNAPVVTGAPTPPKNATALVPPKPWQAKPTPTPMQGIPREWIPSVKGNTWRWIVIHHSATPSGGGASFDRMHRSKGWDELGYHFVIGNGTDTRDGYIEVGSRWPKQKWGAHAKTPDNQYNNFGIGICMVGNFDIDRPTPAQMKSLAKLVAYLEKTYNIAPSRVIGHSDTKGTDCPGRNTSLAEIRRMASLAQSELGPVEDTRLAGHNELLHDAK